MHERYPFRPFAISDHVYGAFFEVRYLRDDPRFIVKEFSGMNMDLILEMEKGKWMDYVVREIRLTQRYLGAFMPKTEIVIGEGVLHAPTLFVVQERIEGKPIDHNKPISVETLAALDRFVGQLVRMYGETYTERSDTGKIPEVPLGHKGNLLLGRALIRPEESERPYLIDAFPLLRLEPLEFQEMMQSWLAYLEDMQERIEAGWQLVPLASRNVLNEVLLDIYRRQR